MPNLYEMSFFELQIHLGNAAYRLWTLLPEPKEDYEYWYYGERMQSLRNALEGHNVEGKDDAAYTS